MSEQQPSDRRPNPVLAFLLNAVLAPTGYVYAGSLRAAVIYAAVVSAVLVLVLAAVWAHPVPLYQDLHGQFQNPGPFRLQTYAPGLLMALALGLHAAAIRRAGPRRLRGAGRWAAAAGLFVAPLLLSLLVRMFGPFAVYSTASASMEPTLAQGDVISTRTPRALCRASGLRPGDVVLHRKSGRQPLYLRRLIAGPGATVELKDGRVIVDGKPVASRAVGVVPISTFGWSQKATVVEERLADGVAYRTLDLEADGPFDDFGPLRIPAETWFVLGDNRDNSLDSRDHGPVKVSDICAVVDNIVASNRPGVIGRRP